MPAHTGLTIITYTAEPGPAAPDASSLLAQLGHRAPPVGATMQLTRNRRGDHVGDEEYGAAPPIDH